jgi:hypothetical protein
VKKTTKATTERRFGGARALVAGLLIGCALPGVALADVATAPLAAQPPAAGYPPAAYDAAPRLAVLDAQIVELTARRDEITLAWPLTLLLGGAALTVVGLALFGSGTCPTDQYGFKTDPSCVDNARRVDDGVALFAVGLVGVGFGTTSLIIRGAKRRHFSRQLAARQLEANALRAFAPRVGFRAVGAGGGALSLAFDF